MTRIVFVVALLLALAFAPGLRSAPITPEQKAKLSHLRNKIATGAQYVPADLKHIRCGTCISIAQQIKGVMGEMASRAAENGTKVQQACRSHASTPMQPLVPASSSCNWCA